MLYKSLIAIAASIALSSAATTTNDPYATYPTVAETASINGFADPIYAELPSCAQPCVSADTGSTPCPYWDTGCLCVMSVWGDVVAECIASSCTGDDVVTATSLGSSICSSAGAPSPYWFLASSDIALLDSAASATATDDSTSAAATSSTAAASATSSVIASSTVEATSSAAATETAEVASSTLVSSAAEVSSAVEVSSASTEASSSSASAVASSATIEQVNAAGLNQGSVAMMGSAIVGMLLCM